MNKYKKSHKNLFKKETAVLFCPDIIYLLPKTYLTEGNLMIICIISYQFVEFIITERESENKPINEMINNVIGQFLSLLGAWWRSS